jgi:CubicO group peptidase (beta-lactamase class C family)
MGKERCFASGLLISDKRFNFQYGYDEGPSIGSFGHRGARRPVMWVDPKNQLVMMLLVERFDMPGDGQKVLYGSFLKAAVEKYGKAHGGTGRTVTI